jgi:hypothetical protein
MKTKDQIIKIMSFAGYEYEKEYPEGRLLFYDTEFEQEIQLWITGENQLSACIRLIKNRAYDNGRIHGKSIVRNGIKSLLEIK